jgi:nickel-dependent lactate racemase
MKPDVKKAINKINTRDWKKVLVEYNQDYLEILVPKSCIELGMQEAPSLPDPKIAIEKAFLNPIGSLTLEEVIRKKSKSPKALSVAIAVSDITRPVPYKGENGILFPLLRRLES